MATREIEKTGAPIVKDETENERAHRQRWLILAVLSVSQLMVILDGTIVNIALPTAQHALNFSNADRQWIVTAYSLAFGSLLLLGGRVSDYIGRKNALIIGLAGFATASAFGAIAQNFTMLVAARTIQGVFGALLAPAVLALLTTTFTDPGERGKAFAIYGAVAGTGGAIGLILGGVLTTYASWRWTLLVNVIIAAIAIGGALPLLKRDRGLDHDPLDIQGVLSVTLGLFALVFGFSHVETTSWHDHYTIGSFVVAAVLLGYFFFVQTRTKYPLLPLRVLADRNRGGSLLAMLVAGVGMFGMFLFLTYFMQLTLGFSAVKTGLAFLPMIFSLIVTAQVSNILLLPKLGPRPLIPFGMALAGVGLFLLSGVTIHTTYTGGVLLPLIVIGLAMGFIFAPAFNTSTLGVAPQDAGVASALVNTSQQIGGSIGTALLNTLAASAATSFMVGKAHTALNEGMAAVHSYTTAFMISAWIFLGGAVAAAVVLRSGAPVHGVSDVPVAAH